MLVCEICKSCSVHLWNTIAGYAHYRCRACNHLFVYPKPCLEKLGEYYDDAAFYAKAEAEELRLVGEARDRISRLNQMAKEYGLKTVLLDVGCASGIFLDQARKEGWTVEGVELSTVLCEKAKAKGLHVMNGWIENLPDTSCYAVVTAWEVIEHSRDPLAFLEQLCSCVQTGGLIALSTPLSDGLPALLLQSRFPMVCPPEHLCLFSRKSLVRLGKRLNLQLVYVRSFSNLRRENLRRGLERYVFGRVLPSPFSSWLSGLCSTLLQPFPRVIDTVGMGSEIEVIFRKVE